MMFPLLHNAKCETMHCDLIVDPFTPEFQQIAGAVKYASRNDGIDFRFIAAVWQKIISQLWPTAGRR
jgi:hypothetical protein